MHLKWNSVLNLLLLLCFTCFHLTLILLTWRIWWAFNNASRWQMGFNLVFKGLNRETSENYKRKSQTSVVCIWKCQTQPNILSFFKTEAPKILRKIFNTVSIDWTVYSVLYRHAISSATNMWSIILKPLT